MKVVIGLALTILCVTAGAAQSTDPAVVSVPLMQAYIPGGFDSNDVLQFMVTGQFSDLCHQVAKQEISFDQALGRITIVQKAYRYSGSYCWNLKVPFEEVATLSPLPPGSYEIWDGAGQQSLGRIEVTRASHSGPGTGTDDYPYAPVTEARLKARSPFGHSVLISGVFPNDCLKLLDVKTEVQKDVVVVQPILQFAPSASGVCTAGYFPYTKEKALTEILGKHPYLIHARSMNGQAVNRLVDPYKNYPFDPASP